MAYDFGQQYNFGQDNGDMFGSLGSGTYDTSPSPTQSPITGQDFGSSDLATMYNPNYNVTDASFGKGWASNNGLNLSSILGGASQLGISGSNIKTNWDAANTLQGLLSNSQNQGNNAYNSLNSYMKGQGQDYLNRTMSNSNQTNTNLTNYLNGTGNTNLTNMTNNGQSAWDRLQASYNDPASYLNSADAQASNRVLNNTLSRQDAANGTWGNDINRAMKLQDNMLANLSNYRQGLAGIYSTAAGNANTANSQYGNALNNQLSTNQQATTSANNTQQGTLENMYNTASRDTATNAGNFIAGNALQNQAYLQAGNLFGGGQGGYLGGAQNGAGNALGALTNQFFGGGGSGVASMINGGINGGSIGQTIGGALGSSFGPLGSLAGSVAGKAIGNAVPGLINSVGDIASGAGDVISSLFDW